MPLEEVGLSKKKSHSRMPSIEVAIPQKVKIVLEDPKEKARK